VYDTFPLPYDLDPSPDHGSDERLRLLVFVDGRLVETRSDSVRGTPWEVHARRNDSERCLLERPLAPPPPPPHVRTLDWLRGLVGGQAALDALGDERTPEPGPPDLDHPGDLESYDAVAEQLDRLTDRFFGAEVGRVLQQALALLWMREPALLRGPVTAGQVAGGLCWVVGKANGLFGGHLTQTAIQGDLGLRHPLSGLGQRVGRALGGLPVYGGCRPHFAPDLQAFGEPLLLTAGTRRSLVRWRDQALDAERRAGPPAVLPSEVDL
jgi:hypothetical protein